MSAVGREIDTVGEGLAEIGLGLIIFRAQAQPEQSVGLNAPFSTTEAVKVGETMKRLQQTVPALTQSWNGSGVEYLGGEFTYDNYQLFTTFPVEKLEDLKGRKIAAAGSAGNWFKGTGAIVVAADLTSYYGSLKDKVVDGVVTFGIAAPAAKLHEVATYMVKVNFGPQYAGGIIANRKWFQDLPEPVRQSPRRRAPTPSAPPTSPNSRPAPTAPTRPWWTRVSRSSNSRKPSGRSGCARCPTSARIGLRICPRQGPSRHQPAEHLHEGTSRRRSEAAPQLGHGVITNS